MSKRCSQATALRRGRRYRPPSRCGADASTAILDSYGASPRRSGFVIHRPATSAADPVDDLEPANRLLRLGLKRASDRQTHTSPPSPKGGVGTPLTSKAGATRVLSWRACRRCHFARMPISPIASCKSLLTSCAVSERSGLSTACMEATGSTAEISTLPTACS